ncbi:MAG: flagellar hook assembly protein FlgD [Gammaproteobacteria bacterium]|nr:flagellar hook assembly protein FlgD [Gammaproteobacteria bacterium]
MTTIAASNSSNPVFGGLDPSSYQLPGKTARGSTELGQEQFLALMIQQFRNQDPLKPQDPSEFLTQLAQVSSVAGISEMNKSMKTLADATYAAQALQASTVVGHDVLAPGHSASLAAGQGLRGQVTLPAATSTGVVSILNSAGGLVRQIPLGNQAAGQSGFTWDGLDSTGRAAAAGSYTVKASYSNGNQDTALDTFLTRRVISVSLGGDGQRTTLTTTDGQQLGLGDIKAIY